MAKRLQEKPDNLSDLIGLPDAQDKTNIRNILKNYDAANPGQIKATIIEARKEVQDNQLGIYGVSNKSAQGRRVLELPEGLLRTIEEAYPLMFADKKQLAWFCRNFKELLVVEKY